MKKFLLIFLISFGITTKAQQPTIGAATIIPQSPMPGDFVKIVTKVTTLNSGILIDPVSFTVTHNPKEIKLKACYSEGMLPALKTYIDTFAVGQLQSGVYTIKHKAYMSVPQQHCTNPSDSNMVVTTLTVPATGTTTGLSESEKKQFSVYPNPVKNKLYFENSGNYTEAFIYQLEGWLVDAVAIDRNGELNVETLSKGLYFIRFSNGDRSKTLKFIKE